MHSFLSPIPCLPFVWKQWTRRDRPSEDWGIGSTTKLTPEALQHPQCFAVMHLAQEKTWMVRWLVAVTGVLPPQRSSPQIPGSPGPPPLCPPSGLHRGKCYLIGLRGSERGEVELLMKRSPGDTRQEMWMWELEDFQRGVQTWRLPPDKSRRGGAWI